MSDYRLISADSHFVEPPNMWAERIDKKFRDRAPHTVKYRSHDLNRLVPLGLITLEDISAGAAELARVAKKGMRGAMIWAEPPDERPYSHPDYDPFWAAAQDLGIPL